MKRILFVVTVMVVCLGPTALAADEATKAAATSKTAGTIIPANDGKWHTVLTTTIKNPTADDDLFIDVSQVNRVTTSNVTTSAAPVSIADARLMMRVQVDGFNCLPGPIVFDEQLTTLSSTLQRFQSLNCKLTVVPNVIIVTSCVCDSVIPIGPQAVACNPPPAPVVFPFITRSCATHTTPDPDTVTTCSLVPGANQAVADLLSETVAHSYDFLCPRVGGMGQTHTVQVQEMLTQSSLNGSASATIGPQTLKVLSVDLKPAQ
jgi:hypothetical protein